MAVFSWAASDLYGDKSQYCPPGAITPKQLALIAKKFLEDHPAKLQEPANKLLMVAYMDAFRCSEAQKKN
jgi:hypothetical protein